HRHGYAVDNEGFSLGEELAHKLCDVFQPLSKRVYSPRKAGDTEWFGDVAHTFHHEQGSLVMVLEVHRGDYRHGEHLGIADEGKRMGFMSKSEHGVFDDTKSRYNSGIVHVSAPLVVGFGNSILEKLPWTLNFN